MWLRDALRDLFTSHEINMLALADEEGFPHELGEVILK